MKRLVLLVAIALKLQAEDWRVLTENKRVKVLEDVDPKPITIDGTQVVSFQSKTFFTDGKHGLNTYYFRASPTGFEWALKFEVWYFANGEVAQSSTTEDSKLNWQPFRNSNHPIDKIRVDRATTVLKSKP